MNTEQKSETAPVLIELEKLKEYLDNWTGMICVTDLLHRFSKPINQYRVPQPQVVEEPIIEIGDTVITKSKLGTNYLDGREGVVRGAGETYSVHGYEWTADEVTLVKKSEKREQHKTPKEELKTAALKNIRKGAASVFVKKSITDRIEEIEKTGIPIKLIREEKPFDLPTAKELFKQGGAAAEVALRYYYVSKLKEKELPHRFEDLETITGYYITDLSKIVIVNENGNKNKCEENKNIYPTKELAEAALALAQLMQLRQEWLRIKAPGWKPDWTGESKEEIWIIYRCNERITCHPTGTAFEHLSFPQGDIANKFKDTFLPLLKTAFCLPDTEPTPLFDV